MRTIIKGFIIECKIMVKMNVESEENAGCLLVFSFFLVYNKSYGK